MAKVLYIKANPKSEPDSITYRISERFIEEYRKKNPKDQIVTVDLYKEDIRFLTAQDIARMFGGQDFDVRHRAEEFASADKYVFASPLWNLSIPAILKAYIDYVSFVGVTFKYTEQGSVGLLAGQGKKVIHIVARGGEYNSPPMNTLESGDRYLRTILGFFGIEDITTIACEATNILQGDELKAAINMAVEKAVRAAADF